MSKYFEVINPDGHLVIDDSYRNLTFLRKIRFNNTTPGAPYDPAANATVVDWFYEPKSDEKIWAVYAPNEMQNIAAIVTDPIYTAEKSRLQFYAIALDNSVDGHKVVEQINNCYLYCFGITDKGKNNLHCGFEVYNASGDTVVTANDKYMRVIAAHTAQEPEGDYSYSIPSDRKVALVNCVTDVSFYSEFRPDGTGEADGGKNILAYTLYKNEIKLRDFEISWDVFYGSDPYAGYGSTPSFMLIDVTNL